MSPAEDGRDVPDVSDGPDAAALAAVVLDEEARRHSAGRSADREYRDEDLLGVGGGEIPLRDAIREGSFGLLLALTAVAAVQSIDASAMGVLAPDIQASLRVSSAVLGAIGGATGVLFVMGAIPIARLADRGPRTKIAGAAHWCSASSARRPYSWAMPFGSSPPGWGPAWPPPDILPVHNSLIADAYPIRARGRIFSIYGLGSPIGLLIGPVCRRGRRLGWWFPRVALGVHGDRAAGDGPVFAGRHPA